MKLCVWRFKIETDYDLEESKLNSILSELEPLEELVTELIKARIKLIDSRLELVTE